MSSGPSVGGDVDAFCTKCKLKLGHTVLAMVGARIARVRCNTCQGEHAYKVNPPGTKAATPKREAKGKSRGSRPESRTAQSFDEMLEGRDLSQARPYAASLLFAKGETIDHPSFGPGVVVDIRGDRLGRPVPRRSQDAGPTQGLRRICQAKRAGEQQLGGSGRCHRGDLSLEELGPAKGPSEPRPRPATGCRCGGGAAPRFGREAIAAPTGEIAPRLARAHAQAATPKHTVVGLCPRSVRRGWPAAGAAGGYGRCGARGLPPRQGLALLGGKHAVAGLGEHAALSPAAARRMCPRRAGTSRWQSSPASVAGGGDTRAR